MPSGAETPGLPILCAPCLETLARAPEGCPRCGRDGPRTGDPCPRCREAPPPYQSLTVVMLYGGSGRDLVLRLKHGHRPDLVRPLGAWMVATAHRRGLWTGNPLVVPVAPWPQHLLERGYSAPVLLAQEIARRACLDFAPRLLVRVRPPGAPDAGSRERAEAVREAFRLRRPIRQRRVLLVDDVVTTGATIAEVSRVLLAGGAETVDALALAMAD